MEWYIAGALFAVCFLVLLVVGVPVVAGLGITSIVFLSLVLGQKQMLHVMAMESFSLWTSYDLLPAPFFILMGELLLVSGTSEDIFNIASKWLRWIPGGLSIVTIGTCAVFATICGSTIAATAAIGVIAIPQMLKRNYDKRLATGSVAAAGSLAHLIPPSIMMVVYASIAELSVGHMFMAGFVPGILLAVAYVVVVAIWCSVNPRLAPREEPVTWKERLSVLMNTKTLPPLVLIASVLVTIYTGIATVTEASALGALVSLALCIISRRLTFKGFLNILLTTAKTVSFIMFLVFASKLFSWAISYYMIPNHLMQILINVTNPWLIMVIIQIAFFVLGMFLDTLAIMLITMPILIPVVVGMGFDLTWFGILFMINMEMAFATPPFGLSLYVVKNLSPPGVSLADISYGYFRFMIAVWVVIGLVIAFPQIALWLPSQMLGR